MTDRNFRFEADADGIAVVTWDMPGRSMNLLDATAIDELESIVERIAATAAVAGAVLVSGKESFSGGADIAMLHGMLTAFRRLQAADPEAAQRQLFDGASRLSRVFRRLETCGKPVVAALHGIAMGGGTELALAAHGRVASDDKTTRIGLPEVKIGIFPGAGGTQRVMRMTDAQAGLQMLMQGQTLDAARAKAMGLVDKVVPRGELVAAAKAMILGGLKPTRPWDEKGYRLTGAQNVYSPAGFQLWPAANALYRKETYDNYPGARAMLQAIFEGLQLPMDRALQVESRYFAHVLQSREAAAMLRSLFLSAQELGKGARRPAGQPASTIRKIGVLGAGFMGAGIAHVTAQAGIEVVLLDRDMAAAEKGKAHAEALTAKAVGKGRISDAERAATLSRIRPTAEYADLAGCDLVIEAVFEDRAVKAAVTAEAAKHLPPHAVFASNTSTLPITSLAETWRDPAGFIGIHFFSPVDRMMLVEIIRGERTGERALAVALDYVKAIRKTPIVVNDARGFYANRCVGAYLLEGHLMLMEGVPPAMIENAARMAGMPVGPLSLTDEVAVDLAWRILQATRNDLGAAAVDPRQERLLHEMVVQRQRFGRKNGKGFYDYSGRDKALWPGLAEIAAAKPADGFDVAELKRRLLAVQALEAARAFEAGIVTDVREADVGSILGFGFAPFTGGTLSYIDGLGAANFVAVCDELADRHGERFRPNALLRDMAERDDTFYGRFPPEAGARQAA